MEKQHYPKYLYHASDAPRVVHSRDEHDALEGEWHEVPLAPPDLIKPEIGEASQVVAPPVEAPPVAAKAAAKKAAAKKAAAKKAGEQA